MLTQRALEILAKYEILERNLDKQDRKDAFVKACESVAWHPATRQTRLAGIQGR